MLPGIEPVDFKPSPATLGVPNFPDNGSPICIGVYSCWWHIWFPLQDNDAGRLHVYQCYQVQKASLLWSWRNCDHITTFLSYMTAAAMLVSVKISPTRNPWLLMLHHSLFLMSWFSVPLLGSSMPWWSCFYHGWNMNVWPCLNFNINHHTSHMIGCILA